MPATLTAKDAARVRFRSLLLDDRQGSGIDPARVVRHFMAIQAQDAPGAVYAVGLRAGLTRAETAAALAGRDVLRTWPMRGTLHLVPARDARWMIALMGGKALAGALARRAQLGLDDAVAHRAVDVLVAATAGADAPVDRSALVEALATAGIEPEGQRAYHLIWFTAQQGLIAGGPADGKEQTFVHVDTWVREHANPTREEALALMAAAYVRGHGPVTEREMSRWTSLGLRDCRTGLAAAEAIERVRVDGEEAWASSTALDSLGAHAPTPTWLLPGFDEAMLGYSQGERPVSAQHHTAVVPGGNGVFKPTVLDGGRVVGTWSRRSLAARQRITISPFGPLSAAARDRIEAAAQRVGDFEELPLDVRWEAAS